MYKAIILRQLFVQTIQVKEKIAIKEKNLDINPWLFRDLLLY